MRDRGGSRLGPVNTTWFDPAIPRRCRRGLDAAAGHRARETREQPVSAPPLLLPPSPCGPEHARPRRSAATLSGERGRLSAPRPPRKPFQERERVRHVPQRASIAASRCPRPSAIFTASPRSNALRSQVRFPGRDCERRLTGFANDTRVWAYGEGAISLHQLNAGVSAPACAAAFAGNAGSMSLGKGRGALGVAVPL